MLSVDGDDAFLLADGNLDCRRYNEEWEAITWETCTLRKWLNEDFYNEAFDTDEKKAVMETTVINANNPNYDTEGGNDTKDKVYLLSIAEASDAAYGFETEFNEDSKTREAKNTDYAKVNNVYSNSNGFGCWWLRSPGCSSRHAADVTYDGYGDNYGDYVHYIDYGVRPILHINLSSSTWCKAGEVRSDGQGDYKPTASPEPAKRPEETEKPTPTVAPTKEPLSTDSPTTPAKPTKAPDDTEKPTVSPKPTKEPESPVYDTLKLPKKSVKIP